MSTQKPTLGRMVIAVVHPDRNGGRDEAPAMITAVNKDDTVELIAFPAGFPPLSLSGYQLHADRAAVDKAAAKDAQHVAGKDPETGQAWTEDARRVHALHWTRGAYWPEIVKAPAKQSGDKTPAT